MNVKLLYLLLILYQTNEFTYSFPFTSPLYPRNSPIAIFTDSVRRVKLSTLKLEHSESDHLLLNNTGFQLQITLNQFEKSSIITGGTLFNQRYTFNKIEFVWNGFWGDRCSHTVDGQGTAVELQAIYINLKYKTFEESLLHPDGMAIIIIPVVVAGHTPNLLFVPLQKTMHKLILPNNTPIRTTGGGPLLKAFFTFRNLLSYYSYPGAYVDVRTNKISPCATIILVPDYARPKISIEQFVDSFIRLKSSNGSPLAPILATFDAGTRPVVLANGNIDHVLSLLCVRASLL